MIFEILTQSSGFGPGVPPKDWVWVESVGDEKCVDVAFGKGMEVCVGKNLCLVASVGKSVCVSVMEVFVHSILPIDVAGVINLNFLDHHPQYQ